MKFDTLVTWPTRCRSTSTSSTTSPRLRQDGHLHAEADLRRQRLGHARAPVDLEGRQAAFAGDKYAGLSETCLYYIGGIIKHAKAINAFTNPSTNSYKRLVPGYEAPVLLAYSARNRSASCRIPYDDSRRPSASKSASPIRWRNPYLAFAAMLMAGLDGIKNKIDPGSGHGQGPLRPAARSELKKIPTVCGSLREALESLDKDRAFLKAGGVFDDDFIDSYIELKMDRSDALRHDPAPGRIRHVLQVLIA
jgi:glutamine synthetase